MLVKRAFQEIRLNSESLFKIAALKEKRVVPVDTNDCRYLRFRAIANLEVNGFNGNFDGFPYKFFEDSEPGYGYKSFIGKRAHLEHNSQLQKRGSIGDLPDAYLNRFMYPEDLKINKWADLDGSKFASQRQSILDLPSQKDGAIEVLMCIDSTLIKKGILEYKTQQGLERIIKMIDTGQKLYCSMGVNIEKSSCSSCGNVAYFANQYCDHIKKGRKGGLTIVSANQMRDMLDNDLMRPEWLKQVVASKYDIDEILKGSSNKGITVRNGEINYKLSFFELSVVGVPAYEQADALEKIASITDMERKDYLRKVIAEVGEDNLFDIYSLLKDDGKIASSCQVGSL